MLRDINKRLPPQFSYYLRKAIRHPSLLRFATLEEYLAARAELHREPAAKSYAQVFDEQTRLVGQVGFQPRRYAKAAVELGRADELLANLEAMPPLAWRDTWFRQSCMVAYIAEGRPKEAATFCRDTLVMGAFNQSTLLRMFGEAYLFEDEYLANAIVSALKDRYLADLSSADSSFLSATLLNIAGEDEMIKGMAGRSRIPDLFFLMSNIALRRADYAGQARYFNWGMAHYGVSTISVRRPDQPLSVNNLSSARDFAEGESGPLVSILVSTYNASDTLISVLDSLCAQTYSSIEVIVIDDCSVDNSYDIAQRYACQIDGRVRALRMPRNGGTYRARNRGLSEAKGAFFTCNDSDDWAHPDKIKTLVRALQSNDRLSATQTSLMRLSSTYGVKPKRQGFVHTDTSSLCFRRESVVEDLGFYESVAFGADSEYVARLKQRYGNSSVKVLDKPLLLADWSKSSLSGNLTTGISDGGTMATARVRYRAQYMERHSEGRLRLECHDPSN